jgi:protein SCO1
VKSRAVGRRLLRRAGVLLFVIVAGACGAGEAVLQGAVRTPPLQVDSVILPSADGDRVALRAADDGLLLVYFGYTSCPDVCPTTMADISAALVELPPELSDRVTVAMVSVDPERDTGEVLSDYLSHFFSRGIALRTDDPTELEAAAAAFGVQWEIADHGPGEPYDVAHTAITYVVDDTGTVVVEWPFGFESEAMASDLTLLLGRNKA